MDYEIIPIKGTGLSMIIQEDGISIFADNDHTQVVSVLNDEIEFLAHALFDAKCEINIRRGV